MAEAPKPLAIDALGAQIADLRKDLQLFNSNLQKDIHSRSSWKLALRNGLVGAIGGLIGSSILVALIVHFTKPLNQIAQLRPVLERLANEQSGKRR